ncbi:hypothetical protein EIP86_007637 [Pleurotus ostreatoroseus]|nr:hypothetical protein EIP86_007637 [Pleurotus ostreatoroseus]
MPSAATHPIAHTVFSATCEATHLETNTPTSALEISTSGSCLSLASLGWVPLDKNVTQYWLPDANGDFKNNHLDVGLAHTVHHTSIDESRKLMFFADKHRIKSFHWDEGSAVHTMQSGNCGGPLAVLSGGRLIRAGQGCAAVWTLDKLDTHGESGYEMIGEEEYEIPEYSMWGHEIEQSTGSVAHTTIKFADPKFKPSEWLLHNPTAYMLCAERRGKYDSGTSNTTDGRGCVSFDLQTGNAVTRYSGRDCQVSAFSTSDGDPNTFATAGTDGYARIFDIREPLSQLKVIADKRNLECYALALAYPDGIPVLFTGGENAECVRVWDLRAKKVVYELATGNNAVITLAWDAHRSTLYASTACDYVDQRGYFHGYRHYKVPKLPGVPRKRLVQPDDDVYMGEEGDEYDSDYDDENYERLWPANATHLEDYFGHPFDAGEHRLYRYRFKKDANLEILPKFGEDIMPKRV